MNNTLNKEKFVLLDAFLTNKEMPMQKFYLAEYPKTKYYILKNGGAIDNAKDIFQEAFLICWKKICSGDFKPINEQQIEAYLFTIAKNKWIDYTRSVTTKKTTSINDKLYQFSIEDNVQTNEIEKAELQMSITLNAFNNLGQSCKDILTQFYFYKAPLRTIAENLGIEEASAKNKKYRCIQKLKEIALNYK